MLFLYKIIIMKIRYRFYAFILILNVYIIYLMLNINNIDNKPIEITNVNNESVNIDNSKYLIEAQNLINSKYYNIQFSQVELSNILIYIDSLSEVYDINKDYIKAMISLESRWKTNALSNKKARGLMQITPICAKDINVSYDDMYDPYKNIEAGVIYLAKLKRSLKHFNTVLVAYNTGPTRVRRHDDKWVKKHKYLKQFYRFLNINNQYFL